MYVLRILGRGLKSYEKHLEELEKVFVLLENAGLKCKFGKCFFCQDEIEYLGYIITCNGIKPNPKKVQAILDIQHPTTNTKGNKYLCEKPTITYKSRAIVFGNSHLALAGCTKDGIQASLPCPIFETGSTPTNAKSILNIGKQYVDVATDYLNQPDQWCQAFNHAYSHLLNAKQHPNPLEFIECMLFISRDRAANMLKRACETALLDLEKKEFKQFNLSKPMKVPHIHEAIFKKDLDRLVSIGVLTKKNTSEWGAPSFIVPKKDGTVRFVTDFRKLNSMIKQNPYPIPHIRDMLLKVSNFQYATSLDLVMGFHNITLSEDAKDICTITTPFGKYSYNRLPMGVCIAPDVFQEKMNNLFNELESVRCYIDDLLVITHGSYEKHLEELEKVFVLLENAGLKCKFRKCFFCQDEIEYLGYIITCNGIKPNPKKVQAILDIQHPTTNTKGNKYLCEKPTITYKSRAIVFGNSHLALAGCTKDGIQASLPCPIFETGSTPTNAKSILNIGKQYVDVATDYLNQPDQWCQAFNHAYSHLLNAKQHPNPLEFIKCMLFISRDRAANMLKRACETALLDLEKKEFKQFNLMLRSWDKADILTAAASQQAKEKLLQDGTLSTKEEKDHIQWVENLLSKAKKRMEYFPSVKLEPLKDKPTHFESFSPYRCSNDLFNIEVGVITGTNPIAHLRKHQYGWLYYAEFFKKVMNIMHGHVFKDYGGIEEAVINQLSYMESDLDIKDSGI